MGRSPEQLSPERLCEAAEAALRAAVEVAEYTGGPWPYPVDLMGGPLQPDYLGAFTRWEIEQACDFLVRLGMLERPRAVRKAK
jgi:hypothetical protein